MSKNSQLLEMGQREYVISKVRQRCEKVRERCEKGSGTSVSRLLSSHY